MNMTVEKYIITFCHFSLYPTFVVSLFHLVQPLAPHHECVAQLLDLLLGGHRLQGGDQGRRQKGLAQVLRRLLGLG